MFSQFEGEQNVVLGTWALTVGVFSHVWDDKISNEVL